jgi:hypothetical protein
MVPNNQRNDPTSLTLPEEPTATAFSTEIFQKSGKN